MNNKGKFIRLFGTIFFCFLLFILAIVILLVSLKYIFGVLDHIPWFSMMFTLFIICVPAVLFITVYSIYTKRTLTHPSKKARIFSYLIFTLALLCWGYFWVIDIITFFKYHYNSIDRYQCFNLAFLSANIGVIFLVGIVQALSTAKELDWMEKSEQKNTSTL